MCPAPWHSSSVEPPTHACSLRLWPIEVRRSAVPQITAVGTFASTSTAWNLSRLPKPGKNSATTSNGVAESIRSTNST